MFQTLFAMYPTLQETMLALKQGRTTSVALTEAALEKAKNPAGEGKRVFTKLYEKQALAAARASDTLRAAGIFRSPIDGIPISIKDLFDVQGETTLAGSMARIGEPAATRNATVVQRLLTAGAVIVGRTNMVEFAYSGLGINPHYGTPLNPWDRSKARIPGGSSSGAGVSVTDGMSVAAIGSDTGGSVRIPAALCGIAGFKPSACRVSTDGVLPLSTQLDSIGPLAASVRCCATLDAIMSGLDITSDAQWQAAQLKGLRMAVPKTVVLDQMDKHVQVTFEKALDVLKLAGMEIEEIDVPEFSQLAEINAKGGFSAAEAWAWHRDLIARAGNKYDPRVLSRIMRGQTMTAADYIDLLGARKSWIRAVEKRVLPYDGLLMPTVPVVAPTVEEVTSSDEAYFAINALMLRNPSFINFLDGCALSIPCHEPGTAPVGLMVAGLNGVDSQILAIGMAIEDLLRARY